MAKKKTLLSFNNGCTFENYIKDANYYVGNFRTVSFQDAAKKMTSIAKKGYDFYKKYQETFEKRSKPGLFSKLFKTQYYKLYNLEQKNLELIRSDLYSLGVPHELLINTHKAEPNDIYKIKTYVEDAAHGVSNGNNSLISNRWREGVSQYVDANNQLVRVEPTDIKEFRPEADNTVVGKVNLSEEFEKENKGLVDEFEVVEKPLVVNEDIVNTK